MTKTARDLRSAAHALRTAANALEETVTALRALSDDLNVPDPEPEPVWPTAPYVWWDGAVYLRDPSDATYNTIRVGMKHPTHCDDCARFAREAVPVVMVPAAEWEVFAPLARGSVTSGKYTLEAARALVQAADAQEVAR